jgi:hypothetical protein
LGEGQKRGGKSLGNRGWGSPLFRLFLGNCGSVRERNKMISIDKFFLKVREVQGLRVSITVKPVSPIAVAVVDKDLLISSKGSGGDQVNLTVTLFNYSITSAFIEGVVSVSSIAGVLKESINCESMCPVRPKVVKTRGLLSDNGAVTYSSTCI